MAHVQRKKQRLSLDEESSPGSPTSAKARPAGKSVAGKGVSGKKSRESAVRGELNFVIVIGGLRAHERGGVLFWKSRLSKRYYTD